MSLKITYVPEKLKPKKHVDWQRLEKGTVFVLGNYFTCLKTDKSFIILTMQGGREFINPRFGNAHGWDDQSIKVIGKLTGIEITLEE